MALDIKQIVILIFYLVATNLFFVLLGNVSGFCDNLPDEFDVDFDENIGNVTDDSEVKMEANNFLNIILNRCEGFPGWIYWLFQVPGIIGVLYVIRGFVGLT